MTSTIGWSLLRRGGLEVAGATVQAREFFDLVVAGRSLLGILTSGGGGHADYMSRIVTGFVDPARELVQELLGGRAVLVNHRSGTSLRMPRMR